MTHFFKSEKGFSLIELVAAFAVLSIVAVSLLNVFTTSVKVNTNAEEADSARMVLNSYMEKFQRVVSMDDYGAGVTSAIQYFQENASNVNLTEIDVNNHEYAQYFDRNFQVVSAADSSGYTLTIDFDNNASVEQTRPLITPACEYYMNKGGTESIIATTGSGSTIIISNVDNLGVRSDVTTTSSNNYVDIIIKEIANDDSMTVTNMTNKELRLFVDQRDSSGNLLTAPFRSGYQFTLNPLSTGTIIVNDGHENGQAIDFYKTHINNFTVTMTLRDGSNNVIYSLVSDAYGGR